MSLILNSILESIGTVSLNSTNIIMLVIPYNFNSPPSYDSDGVKVTLPQNGIASSSCNDTRLSQVLYKGSIYERLAPYGFQQAANSLALELIQCEVRQSVSGLQDNIIIEIPIDPGDVFAVEKAESIRNGTSLLEEAACSYYDPVKDLISSEGCELIEVRESHFKCGCNHMTDFMMFLRTGGDVLI